MAIFRDTSKEPFEHDRSIEDRRRHKELVEKTIKDNLGDLLSNENIVGESKNKKYKIPIRGLKEYSFIYGRNNKNVAMGDGKEKRTDKIFSEEEKGKAASRAGKDEGEDIYETEITLEELLEYLIDDFELPNLDKKKFSKVISQSSKKKRGYQRFGVKPRLAKKKTVIAKIARKQSKKRALNEAGMSKDIQRMPFNEEDIRYYKLKQKPKKESNAVMIFIMDVSGSMDNTKKYLARSFFFVLSRFIKKKYENTHMIFISHTTIAKEVNEYEFFHKAESGGTYISSGIKAALKIIEDRYSKELWNIYTFYASDGDNWSEDNEKALESIKSICACSNLVGYAELLPSTFSTTMYFRVMKEIKNDNFVSVCIKDKKELWKALKIILRKELRREKTVEL